MPLGVETKRHKEAFDYWLELGGHCTGASYALVGARFGLTKSTVANISQHFKWRARKDALAAWKPGTFAIPEGEDGGEILRRRVETVSLSLLKKFEDEVEKGTIKIKNVVDFVEVSRFLLSLHGIAREGTGVNVNIISAIPRPPALEIIDSKIDKIEATSVEIEENENVR